MDQENEGMSSLAIDVAVSRLSVAAAKAKANLKPNDAERSSAVRLKKVLIRQIESSELTSEIPEGLALDDEWRELLKKNLPTLPIAGTAFTFGQPEALRDLVRLINIVESGKLLSETEANDLTEKLEKIQPSPVPTALQYQAQVANA